MVPDETRGGTQAHQKYILKCCQPYLGIQWQAEHLHSYYSRQQVSELPNYPVVARQLRQYTETIAQEIKFQMPEANTKIEDSNTITLFDVKVDSSPLFGTQSCLSECKSSATIPFTSLTIEYEIENARKISKQGQKKKANVTRYILSLITVLKCMCKCSSKVVTFKWLMNGNP